MEKLIYLLYKPAKKSAEDFRSELLNQSPKLNHAGAKNIRLCIIDEDVKKAEKLYIQNTTPSPDAMLSFWLNTAIDHEAIEVLIKPFCKTLHGYLVTESEPLENKKHPATNKNRTPGMNQVVLLRKPERLTREQWIDIWHNSHTQIAIDTQSTFGYRQNVVARSLTNNPLALDAIVEENFPSEAMDSAHAFYNADKNDALLKERQEKMINSVQRFIDFDQLDCLPMSEYNC